MGKIMIFKDSPRHMFIKFLKNHCSYVTVSSTIHK